MTFNETPAVSPFKANIFVDWLNLKANGGQALDFWKLMELIVNRGGMVRRANIYLPEVEQGQVGFYDAIKKAGFKLIVIPPKGDGINCDTMMSVDMVTQSYGVDVVYLLSNDADFVPAVEYLQSIGKRVLLIHAHDPSNQLRRAVDEWRMLEQLKLLKEG
jgi:hypothetical protein